jgi:hypothetical protein
MPVFGVERTDMTRTIRFSAVAAASGSVVLMSQEGYEGLSIQLYEYSPTGFQPVATEFACGC